MQTRLGHDEVNYSVLDPPALPLSLQRPVHQLVPLLDLAEHFKEPGEHLLAADVLRRSTSPHLQPVPT